MKSFLSLSILLLSLPAPSFGFSSTGQPKSSRTQTQNQVSSRVDFVKSCLSSLAFTTLLPQKTNADANESSALETALSAKEAENAARLRAQKKAELAVGRKVAAKIAADNEAKSINEKSKEERRLAQADARQLALQAAADRRADFAEKKASERSNNLLVAKEAEAKNRELSALAKANKDKLLAEIKEGRDPQREKFNEVFSNGLVNTLTATSLFALSVPRVAGKSEQKNENWSQMMGIETSSQPPAIQITDAQQDFFTSPEKE